MNRRWTDAVRRELLPNGLTLLAQKVPGATAVSVVSHVRAGFFDEPDPLSGVSHVLEHMLFKGTPTRGVGQLAQEMKAAGGYLNAGTGYDHTAYYAVLPPESLAVALELEADALRRSLIDPQELGRELRVIVEEAKRKLDTPGAVAGETLHALLFDVHRIRRWRIGTEAQLTGLTHSAVVGYYRSRYVPSRTIVAMAGALDPDSALAAARECFEGWNPAAGSLDPSPPEPAHHEVRTRTLRGDVRRADLVLGWRSVPARHADAAALDVAAVILGSGRASWLYRALRVPGLVTSLGVSHFSPTEVGVFSVAAELDPERLDPALMATGAALARLRDQGPEEADLARARTLLVARWARQLQTADGRAAALAAAEALGGVELLDDEYERLLSVGGSEIRRVAGEWLRADSVAAVVYLPNEVAADLEVPQLTRAFAGSAAPPPPLPLPPPRALPAPQASSGRNTGAVLHVALAGADLLLARHPGVPLASLAIYRARTVPDTRAAAGLAALAVRSAVRGAGDLDSAGLALSFEGLGGSVVPLLSPDWFGFGTSVLAEHTDQAAALLDLVLTRPVFLPGDIERERATLADEAARAADDMMRYPLELAFAAAFGDSAYGLPSHGFPESVTGLTGAMVKAWHACELAAGRTLFVGVGDFEPPQVADRLAGLFAAGPARAASGPLVDRGWRAPGYFQSVVPRDRRQTALAVLFPGPSRTAEERFPAELWAAIASGLGGRLFGVLRDRHSLAYSVFATSWQRAGAGALLLYLATSPEREEEARTALLAELARFAERVPDSQEMSRAGNYLAGQVAVRRQTAGSVAGEIAEAWLAGTGLEELRDPAARYRAVGGEAVRRLAQACFDPARRVEGIVRGG